MEKLKSLLQHGLEGTASLWEPVQRTFSWVHTAARILDNEEGFDGIGVRRRMQGLLGAMTRWQQHAGELQPAVGHFLKVTRSYWPGLFHCYNVPGLPRTNNDLEHLFGAYRYHERRTTGHKVASSALVLRGTVRIVAAVATRQRTFTAADLIPADIDSWRMLRTELEVRNHSRVLQRRFRREPDAYLQNLEAMLDKLILPS